MSMYTPGPWECDLQGYGAFAIEADSRQGGYIVIADRGPHRTRAKEMHANALLISAAPELLEALQSIVRSLSDQDDEGLIEHAEPMINARAAIAKALGNE